MLSFFIDAFHGLYLATADVLMEHTANPDIISGVPFVMMVLLALIIIQVIYWLLAYAVYYTKQLLHYIVDYDEIQLLKKRKEMHRRALKMSQSTAVNFSMRKHSR